jgi:hypothetical protein
MQDASVLALLADGRFTETEAEELLSKAEEFRDLVEKWILKHHPHYAI